MEPFASSPEIARALKLGLPVVALESTVITHGLPHPQNVSLAHDMEATVRDEGAVPATIAILSGKVQVGLSDGEIDDLARSEAIKVSRRDIAAALFSKASGGTTVAGTMFIANRLGIHVFATGGIGGVHREARLDISSDLQSLADTPMIVVCAGAKAILDLPATLEYLETMSVPVVGYKTSEFPAFYSPESGLRTPFKLDSPEDIVAFARAHWDSGMRSAILVANPIPPRDAISKKEMDPIIAQASEDAIIKKIRGQALTPFLLQRIKDLSDGKSLNANIALLLNNARLGASIARAMSARRRERHL